jgi:hypothetical protein
VKVKRSVPVKLGTGFIYAEVDCLSFRDITATTDLCMDGFANSRAMELASKFHDDRTKGLPSAVYVVAAEHIPVCKIGVATNPIGRLLSLQIGNWHELSVESLLWFDNGAVEIEQTALRAAKEMGIYLRGEWVEATAREAAELVVKAARHIGKPAYDSETWIENWSARVNALAEAKGRSEAIGKLPPRGRKSAA